MTFIRCKLSGNAICVISHETKEVWYNEMFSLTFIEFAVEKFSNTGQKIITLSNFQ